MPLPGLNPEIKKRYLQQQGFDVALYDVDDEGQVFQKQPSSIPTNGNTSQLSGLNLGTRVSSAAPQPTALQSFGRGAAEGALPAAGGILGGAGGLALATVLAPETAGLSFLLPLAGAILGGTGAGYAQKELVPEDVKQRFFTRPEDVEANPVASYLGNVAPNALAFNPVKSLRDLPALASAIRKTPNVLRNTSTLTAAEHAAAQNALINAGVSGSFQLPGVISGEQPFSFGRLAADVGTGSLLTRPTGLGRKLGFKAPPEGRVFEPAVSVPEDVVPAATGPQQEARQFGIVPEGALINQEGKVKPLQTTKTLRAIFGSEGERFGGKERLAEDYRRPFKSAAESGEVIRQQELEPLDKRVAESQKILEERRQAELEIERQRTESVKLEAEELKAANERRKVDLATGLKKGYGEEVPLEQRLQTRVEEGRLQGEEQRPETNLGKVLNKAKLTKAQQQELEAPLSEGERIQDEYDRGLREAGESTLPPTPKQETNIEELPFSNLPTNKLTPEIKAKFKQSVEAEAARRGFKVVYKPRVVNAEGKEVMGIYNRNTRTIELSDLLAAGDIPSHEASHGLFYDYLRSTSKADQRLALDAMEFADPAGRKFRNPEDFLNLPESEQVPIEEAAIRNMGVEGYRRRRVDLYGNKRQRFTQWWEDVKSHAKVKFGAAGGEDVQRHFSTRLATDAPYGTRGELAPTAGVRVAATLTGREAEESSLPAKTDLQQYQDVQSRMRQLMAEGKSGGQEFQDAWKENETIKNRHGGMPPVEPTNEASIRKSIEEARTWFSEGKISREELADLINTYTRRLDIKRVKAADERTATDSALPEQPGEGAGPTPIKGRNVGEDIQEQLADSSVKAAQETIRLQQDLMSQNKSVGKQEGEILEPLLAKFREAFPDFNDVQARNALWRGLVKEDSDVKSLLEATLGEGAVEDAVTKLRETRETAKTLENEERTFSESSDKANKKAEELHAFSRPDVERQAESSALPKEEGTPTPEGRSSFAPMFTARIDKIAEVIKTPTAREVTKKLNRAWSEADLLEGRIGNKLVAVSRGYEPEEIARVREFRHETDAGKKPSFTLTANEQQLKGAYDKTYKEIGELINKEGPGIETKSGEFRRIKLKPEGYQENIIASKVIDAWAESKAEAAQYDKDYIDHLLSKGVSKEEATKTLSDYKQAVGNVGRTPETNFGAIRKAEGYGLPWSLVEQNANASVSRYGRRAAADLSYYKNIESDPRMLKALGISDKSGRRFESLAPDQQAKAEDVEFIGNAKEVQAALRSVRGLIAPPNPRLQSAARLVGSAIMQTGTAIRNLVQLPVSAAPYYGSGPLAAIKAFSKMNERAGRAFESNAIRPSFKDFDAAGDFDGNPDKFVRLADKVVSFMRKWTGRDLSDKIEGEFTYSLGEELATKWFAGAKVGDIEARRMLNRFGTTLDGNVKDRFLPKGEVTADDISRVAKQFVNATRGTYGPSGLPSVAIEGNLAPFLSLSRWSIERSNTFYKDVIKPMQEGNYAPFLKTSLAAVISGAAIEKLNEMLSGKKGQDPTINEVLASGDKEDLVAKGIGILQLGSFAGIVGDMMKLGANVAQGKETKFSSPISFPAASLAETMATNTSNMVEAIRNGEDPFEVMALYLKDILKTSQNARYVMARTNQKETERAGKFRDVRVFQELTGRRDPTSYPSPNQYDNLKSKKFKRTGDLGEAAGLLPELLSDAVASGDIETIRKELKGLKANSYQSFPDFEKNPIEAAAYLQHLSKTQGEDVAMKRLTDFLIQREINKAKGSLLPSI